MIRHWASTYIISLGIIILSLGLVLLFKFMGPSPVLLDRMGP